jgi:hypothetical protein
MTDTQAVNAASFGKVSAQSHRHLTVFMFLGIIVRMTVEGCSQKSLLTSTFH